jgi:AraC family transcriptional regulator
MNRTQREYVQRINRVMDYIDGHLGDPLPLDRLAEVASFSKFHFHRIFYAHCGETPGQYIQRLRVGRAARVLISDRDATVTEIAYDSGFTDVAAFSRAFRNAYGTSPSAYRDNRRNLGTMESKDGTAPAAKEGYDHGISHRQGGEDMPELEMKPFPATSVDVVEKPELTVAYVRHTGPYFGDSELFQRLFQKLYAWAAPRNLIKSGETETIIIYHDDPSTVEPEKLRVSCCITVPDGTDVEGEVGTMKIEAGRYAEAHFTLNAMQFGGAWNWVFGVWLPESGYQPDDKLCYERYPDPAPDSESSGEEPPMFNVDICVPVKPL